jgi:hypothetical protein
MDGIWIRHDDHHKAISYVVRCGIWAYNDYDDDIKVRGVHKVDFPGEISGLIEGERRGTGGQRTSKWFTHIHEDSKVKTSKFCLKRGGVIEDRWIL